MEKIWILENPKLFQLRSAKIKYIGDGVFEATMKPDILWFNPCLTTSLKRAKFLVKEGCKTHKNVNQRMKWKKGPSLENQN